MLFKHFNQVSVNILVDAGLDAALRRVGLQVREDGECFRLLPIPLPLLLGAAFVMGDDAVVERRVADLPHARGKGVTHGGRSVVPVVRVTDYLPVICTGCRRGKLCALRWSGFPFESVAEPATVVSRCRSGGAGVDVPNRIDARVFSLISVSARP